MTGCFLALFAVSLHFLANVIGVKSSEVDVPIFLVKDLLTGTRSEELVHVLSTTGLLSVVDIHDQDGVVTDQALEGLCACKSQLLDVDGTDTATLDDDATIRTTLATATAGKTPLPLPENLATHCGSDIAAAMEGLRDKVATASDAFVVALDRLILGASTTPLLQDSYGGSYKSLADIRKGANHLEHFHVYSKQQDDADQQEDTLRWHVDAGLFLTFVPAHDCEGNSPDASFWFMNDDKEPTQAVFAPNSVTVMMGAGVEHWLDMPASLPLKATKHAVKMRPRQSRAWYGMMHLVSESAIIQSEPERTFGDMKQAMTLSNKNRRFSDDDISIGCGHAIHKEHQQATTTLTQRRRRLQHVQDPSACNNSTNFFCWMQCLDIPNVQSAQGYVNEGYSLYCLDPAILATSGNRVSTAAKPCEAGHVHNANCMGVWQPTAPTVIAADLVFESNSNNQDMGFCYGGTSMYMDGFHWTNTVCIIYLFQSWVLSTPGKLVAACFGTLGFGAAVELVIHQRRLAMTSLTPGYKRLAASSLFYGVQLTMGYLLMLVVMTYSAPLFICVVLGIVGGHILFNAQDALFRKKTKPQGKLNRKETNHEDSRSLSVTDQGGCCSNSSGSEHIPEVPEGSTPCCQNLLEVTELSA